MSKEICNECGTSVKIGTSLFINRITDFNDYSTRKEMGKPFPKGQFICLPCEIILNKKVANVEN